MKLGQKIMNRMMLSCKKASELFEKKTYFKLSTIEKMQLSAHSKMCDACSKYQKESSALDEILKLNADKQNDSSEVGLSDDFKSRIIRELKNKK